MPIQPRLQPGMLAYVLHIPTDPNTVRAQPDTGAAQTGSLQPGVVMEVLGNPRYPIYPVHNDGMIFWWVRSPALARPGWTSEGDIGHYWLEPIVINHNGQPAGHYYRVRAGDTLNKITASFGKTLQQVETANPGITNPDQAEVNQRVWIPG